MIGFVIVFAVTAYLTLGLQLLLGSRKRAIVERAEEMGPEDDSIPLTQRGTPASFVSNSHEESPEETVDALITAPDRAQDPSYIRNAYGPPERTTPPPTMAVSRQDPRPLTRSQRWATYVVAHIDASTYAFLLLLIGIPVYFTTRLTFAIHLPLSVICYFIASSLPPSYTRIIHPVLLSSALTIFGIYLFALSHHHTIQEALHSYTTKTRYPQLFSGQTSRYPLPGAGDILSSLLDVSIVALALPMYRYRIELRRHFPSILLPNILLAVASLFGYPALSYALSISSSRSLAFASRSLTLALATPATQNLGGDLQLVAVLCIMSGVMGVLIGPTLMKWLRVPDDDYVTRGVTMGANSSAIATAVLLREDPRAAALSCLSMSVFGTVMVGLCSVPPAVSAVRGLVGL